MENESFLNTLEDPRKQRRLGLQDAQVSKRKLSLKTCSSVLRFFGNHEFYYNDLDPFQEQVWGRETWIRNTL